MRCMFSNFSKGRKVFITHRSSFIPFGVNTPPLGAGIFISWLSVGGDNAICLLELFRDSVPVQFGV